MSYSMDFQCPILFVVQGLLVNQGLLWKNIFNRQWMIGLGQSIFLSTKQPLKAEVMSLFEECSDIDWDGYGAWPISEKSVSSAMLFINAIPTRVIMPELSASPDGGVTFEWVDDRIILSISIYENIIVYAQLIDESKQYGEMNFMGEIPDAVLEPLLKFFQKVTINCRILWKIVNQ